MFFTFLSHFSHFFCFFLIFLYCFLFYFLSSTPRGIFLFWWFFFSCFVMFSCWGCHVLLVFWYSEFSKTRCLSLGLFMALLGSLILVLSVPMLGADLYSLFSRSLNFSSSSINSVFSYAFWILVPSIFSFHFHRFPSRDKL